VDKIFLKKKRDDGKRISDVRDVLKAVGNTDFCRKYGVRTSRISALCISVEEIFKEF
jgi:hypothetical protein